MLYAIPRLTRQQLAQLRELDELRTRLDGETREPRRWVGRLRRQARATAVASSTAIEGFTVADSDALDLVDRVAVVDDGDEDRVAVASYAHALRHVDALADDPSFRWLDRVILDLHFDACAFHDAKRPGRWRTGPVYVTRAGGGAPAFEGPSAAQVPKLMREVVGWLQRGDLDAHPVVRAAMAHLHVVSVHPFEDGNGRVARIVQSLVLARDGVLAPELTSIEEQLGERTADYYAVLQQVQGGGYQPQRDARPWIAFCLEAHLAQAQRRLRQVADAGSRWGRLEALAEQRGWPERLVIALEQSLFGAVDRAAYAAEADVSPATASADFRRLLDAGLVVASGRGRSVRYGASARLRDLAAGRA
ncbi:Fic family protein [Conexibacter sp. JD483]|uniref:Fic family protein n=1 Tax=unclassified Conexibacter TaxID=2627773 RepID=UPI002715E520|nr:MULTISPECIES: Fic family protein [unclassified Conexibacter]MDO8185211.1 Fic family protein [Conexibacter sp. CPCC 205706]MDO8198257.1 Fic family protein [Conexibacter sp. CPCC 205762]MDR9367781.1 Fic family protein [Conexibacter sp. JD483]